MKHKVTPAEILVENTPYSRGMAKRVILREGLLPYQCALCLLESEWNGKPLVLRLDHINGVNNDDRIENLRFLCPNCDSQTDTFCGRNMARAGTGSRSKAHPCSTCPEGITLRIQCRSCAAKRRFAAFPRAQKIAWPSLEELNNRLATTSFVAVAKELGVSDNAIRKRLLRVKCDPKKRPVRHGSQSAYSYHRCRCEICVSAATIRGREYRARVALRALDTQCEI